MEERITKQQLMKMYNVNRTTIEEWRSRVCTGKAGFRQTLTCFCAPPAVSQNYRCDTVASGWCPSSQRRPWQVRTRNFESRRYPRSGSRHPGQLEWRHPNDAVLYCCNWKCKPQKLLVLDNVCLTCDTNSLTSEACGTEYKQTCKVFYNTYGYHGWFCAPNTLPYLLNFPGLDLLRGLESGQTTTDWSNFAAPNGVQGDNEFKKW